MADTERPQLLERLGSLVKDGGLVRTRESYQQHEYQEPDQGTAGRLRRDDERPEIVNGGEQRHREEEERAVD